MAPVGLRCPAQRKSCEVSLLDAIHSKGGKTGERGGQEVGGQEELRGGADLMEGTLFALPMSIA